MAAGATPIEAGGGAAAQGASSPRARKSRNLDTEAPKWDPRRRDQYYEVDQQRRQRQRSTGGDGSVQKGEEEEALILTLARALTLTTDP